LQHPVQGFVQAGELAEGVGALKHPLLDLGRNLLALVVFTLGNASDAFLLVRAGELGVPTALLPLLWCACHVVKSTSNLLLGRAVDQFGPRPFVFLGWFVYAGSTWPLRWRRRPGKRGRPSWATSSASTPSATAGAG
jgi:hypothetical protein